MSFTTAASSPAEGLISVSGPVDRPRLTKTDASCIRVLLRAYDQYVREIWGRAEQFVPKHVVSTEPYSPVGLKFCIDGEMVMSLMSLGLFDFVNYYANLSDSELRTYLDNKAEKSKEFITLDVRDNLAKKELRMNISDSNAPSRVKNLFASYRSLLPRNGLKNLIDENQKLAVIHVLLAI